MKRHIERLAGADSTPAATTCDCGKTPEACAATEDCSGQSMPAATAPAEAGEVKPHCCVCDSGIVTCWVDAKAHNREVARRVKAEQDYNGLLVQFGEGLDSAQAYVHEHNNEEPFYSGLGRHVWTLILKDAKKQRHRAEKAEAEAAALRETVAECRALIARPYNAVYDLVEDLDAALRGKP